VDFDGFAANDRIFYASLRAWLIVSEAARKPGADAENVTPSQTWPAIRSIGNVLRHEYDGADPTTV
jgi:uncharacterized protein with HEPN domain